MNDGKPRVMIFPVTMSCNSRCRSCGIWKLPRSAKAHVGPELLQRIVSDALLTEHVESINLSGGEPFTHPTIGVLTAALIASFQRLREVCINTDGHLLDEMEDTVTRVLPLCAQRSIKLRMYISLDGLGDAHDRHRRHPGAFALADRALRRLSTMRWEWPDNLRVTASFTITDWNVDQIVPVLHYVQELGLRVDYNLAARPEVFIGGAGLDKRFQVTPDQVARVRAAMREVCASPDSSNFTEPFYATMLETLQTGRRRRGCFFPAKGFVLMPDGKLYICGTYLDFFFGDLLRTDFETAWTGALRADCRQGMIPGKCAACFSNS